MMDILNSALRVQKKSKTDSTRCLLYVHHAVYAEEHRWYSKCMDRPENVWMGSKNGWMGGGYGVVEMEIIGCE
jgi:hypothetical protein